uniref:Uncharacterized protein n=1 Tax=Ditylum brightwellii TaxID=49249 RepID=A0A7S4SK36_9STRA
MSIEPLLSGYQIGMQTGDIQMAMLNAYMYKCSMHICTWWCGQFHLWSTDNFISGQLHLAAFKKHLKVFGEQMVEYKQMVFHHLLRPMEQVVSNLLLSTGEPLLLIGRDKEQECILNKAIEQNNRYLAASFFWQLKCFFLVVLRHTYMAIMNLR